MIKLPTYLRPPPALRERRLREVAWPHAEEQLYEATLLYAAKSVNRGIRQELLPELSRLVRDADRKLKRADSLSSRLVDAIDALRAEYGISRKEARSWAIRMHNAVSVQHADQFAAAYGEVLTINPLLGKEKWLVDAMGVSVEQNVDLITSIPEQQLSRVEQLVSDAVLNGTRAEALAAQLVEAFGIGENRALLIAQDQVGKWHGSLQRLRQEDAGVVEYIWSTSSDARVRPKHRAREGKVFRWDSPPDDGHPGMPVRCRCVAVPRIPDWTDNTEDA